MPVTRVGPTHQITIAREAFDQLGLEPEDFLEVQVRDGVICLIPQKLVPRDQAWFWTREWQEREGEAAAGIADKELSGPFESVDDLIRHLRETQ